MKNQVRKFRRYQRMSLAELAEKSEVAASTIGDIERGVEPKLRTAAKISRTLGVSIFLLWPEIKDLEKI